MEIRREAHRIGGHCGGVSGVSQGPDHSAWEVYSGAGSQHL